ncbi:MAG: hypothetical protein LBU41_05855 [Clostridiales Family XIII bacterium]|nr:hypothetical protein [Clostridiales Family XIII bacterium]
MVKQKKKYFAMLLAFSLIFLLAACGESEKAKSDTIEGNLSDIMNSITQTVDATLGDNDKLPMTGPSLITKENATGMTGLSPEDFVSYVEDAYGVQGMLSTTAFEVVLIRCKSFEDAATVKELVATNFDPGKWICVRPENCTVIDSGSYVLLAVSSTAQSEAIVTAFTDLSKDNVGEPNVFYKGE